MQPSTTEISDSEALDQANAALVTLEGTYFSNQTDSNWKAVEKARSAVSQIETRIRIADELARKAAAEARAAERARKAARLDEILARLATQNDRVAQLGQRIAAAILTAKDLVLIEENAMVDESHALVGEANDLKEALGDPRNVPRPLSPYCCDIPSSEAVSRAMPEGIHPTILSQYAGKYWG